MADVATEISRHVWETKYRYADRESHEQTIADTWVRLARAAAAVEAVNAAASAGLFELLATRVIVDLSLAGAFRRRAPRPQR
jgi:hypothetical protein